MTKQLLLITLLALRITDQSFNDSSQKDPFTGTASFSLLVISNIEPQFFEVKSSIQQNKIVIDWVVNENQLVDQFEVEKSRDGINFSTAAIVFGTDNDSVTHYRFYEKAVNQKLIYRIRLITKNKVSVYSEQVEIHPSS